MYIINITHLFPNYCEENTEKFDALDTLYFQVGEQLRLTVIIYENETPYFLLSRKDRKPVDHLAYFFLTAQFKVIQPGIRLPEMVDQFYNQKTGILHIRGRVQSTKEE